MSMDITIIDDFLTDPVLYRGEMLTKEFSSFRFGDDVFHGISPCGMGSTVPQSIAGQFPHCAPLLSFVRRSPKGQVEPNFIHNDKCMGDWTAILYLNPQPPEEDGTTFWDHSGQKIRTVQAKFNRLLMFPAILPHSRAIFDNYGEAQEARLVQVTFGKWGAS